VAPRAQVSAFSGKGLAALRFCLELRHELDKPDDRDRRDFRRMTGQAQLSSWGTIIPGPYTKRWRERWLRRVLDVQQGIRRDGPEEFRHIQLITLDELHEVRRIWLYEKHEFDDALPRIYEEATGEAFPRRGTDAGGLRAEDWDTLREVCGDQALFDLQIGLLGVERQYRGMARRAGIYEALEERLRTGIFGNEQEAVAVLSDQERRRKAVKEQSGPGEGERSAQERRHQAANQGTLFRVELPLISPVAEASPEEQG
jgi:DNA sulfur modification protein DndC